MIISASRRTDIPGYYFEWFLQRLKEEYVLVRNPWNPHQVSRVSLSPQVVDGIVFWTKNPAPVLERLGELSGYHYYFQFTLTPYGPEIEPNLPSKNKVIIPAFQRLSRELGKERVIWRYDPIFLSSRYTWEYHCRYFEVLAARLASYTNRCTVSFLDWYRKTRKNAGRLGIVDMNMNQQKELLGQLVSLAGKYGITLDVCGEEQDYSDIGAHKAHCIDKGLLEQIGNYKLKAGKDKSQRAACGCVSSIDIGAYDTCPNGCLYCYANGNPAAGKANYVQHDPLAPLLFGTVTPEDVIHERDMKSLADGQISLFG